MKKILLLLALTTFTMNAQEKFDFPLNENGQIIFTEVVPAEGKTKDDLYNNSKMFFVNIYKETQDKLKQNKEASSVSDTQYSFITIKANGSEVKLKLFYTIEILSKDGKYKYEIKNIITKRKKDVANEMLKIKAHNQRHHIFEIMKSLSKDGKVLRKDLEENMKLQGYKASANVFLSFFKQKTAYEMIW